MLSKLKRPSLYINHGVWVIVKEDCSDTAVKGKISSVNGYHDSTGFHVDSVSIQGVGVFKASDVYMTRAAALTSAEWRLRDDLRGLQKEMDRALAAFSRNKEVNEGRAAYLRRRLENTHVRLMRLMNKEEKKKDAIEKAQELWDRAVHAKEKEDKK